MNKKYSYKDFTGLDFSKVDVKEFDDEIIGTCFSQSSPMTKIFPPGMTGVSFVKCNLDNVDVPAGNTQKDCCNRQWKEQNDLIPWIVSAITLQPIEPLHKEWYERLGLSTNPADIPTEKMDKDIISKTEEELNVSAEIIR